MELYGRPHVARRKTSPNVSFLNDSTPREETTVFAPPNSSRNQEKEESWSSHNDSDPTTATLFRHSKPPLSGRPTLDRPQSGGIRRPLPGALASSATMVKQRPSTARESSRTLNRPQISSEVEILFTRRQSETKPESEGGDDDAEKQDVGTSEEGGRMISLDEAYIRQLKGDILYCHELLSREQGVMNPTASRSHNHLKNIQSMRESRLSHHITSTTTSDTILGARLARYSYSSDPTQLQSAKTRLEDLLGQALTRLMQQFLEIREENTNDDDSQLFGDNAIELQRPMENHVPFANGCGSDSASIYACCLFGVFQRVEKFRTMIIGLQSEKSYLLKEIKQKDDHAQRLSEQIELFKDALAKAVSRGFKNEAQSQANKQIFVQQAEDRRPSCGDSPLNPEIDIEKELERSFFLHSLERERVGLEDRISKLQSEVDALNVQLKLTRAEGDQRARAASSLQITLDETAARLTRDQQMRDQQERELQNALKTMTTRCKQLEEVHEKEKQALRTDKQQLDVRIQHLEAEVREKTNSLSQNATTAAELKRTKEKADILTAQLKASESKLMTAVRECNTTREECTEQRALVTKLRHDLDSSSKRLHEIIIELQQSRALLSSQASNLRQTELKLSQVRGDVERQASVIQHQANQVSILEARLSQSVSLDQDEQRRRHQEEETAWHQKVSALEDALVVERQTIQSLKEQHLATVAMERDKAEHSISQAKAVSLELETANLCLGERKKQRDKELQEFADQKAKLLDRISQLMSDLDAAKANLTGQQLQHQAFEQVEKFTFADKAMLESRVHDLLDQLSRSKAEISRKLDQLQTEYEMKLREREDSIRQSFVDQIESYKCVADSAHSAEMGLRHQLDIAIAERDVLAHKLQGQQSTPRGSALSEARVELQKAKLRITALEEKLNKSDTARGRDSDGKQALLAAREKKLLDDQKHVRTSLPPSTKKLKQELSADKKQLRLDREALESSQAQVEADKLRNTDERKLLRQIITLLASRLALQMELLHVIPPELTAAANNQQSRLTGTPSSLIDFVTKFQLDHCDQWREIQIKWEKLQQEVDDADWQLVHMRNRLEELNLNSLTPQPAMPRPKTPITSPFSDAVAAGKDTLPVVEQLHASVSKAAISKVQAHAGQRVDDKHDEQSHCETRVRDEENETFTVALRKEMRAMKESYESKLDDLQREIHKVQKLRMESTQRLRVELDDEKKRSQQIISQLTDRCTTLEAQLHALQRAMALMQDRQIDLLQQYRCATTDSSRSALLRMLHAAVEEACKEEMARREAREQDRVRKLLDYCGSSSVTVERDDKKRLL